MKIQGNTILISGGGSGIGLAIALELKHAGNEVIVAGRSQAKLEDARSKGLKVLTRGKNKTGITIVCLGSV